MMRKLFSVITESIPQFFAARNYQLTSLCGSGYEGNGDAAENKNLKRNWWYLTISTSAIKSFICPLGCFVAVLIFSNESYADYPPLSVWSTGGYYSPIVWLPPSGDDAFSEWHRRWPGYSDMNVSPSACSS